MSLGLGTFTELGAFTGMGAFTELGAFTGSGAFTGMGASTLAAFAPPFSKGGLRGVLRLSENLPRPLLAKEPGKHSDDALRPGTSPPSASQALVAPPSAVPAARWLPVLLILIAVAIAYANSLGGAFVLDDHRTIEQNIRIRHLWSPAAWLFGHRPVVDLTFAVNYAIHGLRLWGYHVVNIAIHALAALTLFGFIRRTLALPSLRERFAGTGVYLAAAIALVWAVHPLQTESVTYLIQRSESLMGLFYLLTLYCVVRGATVPRGSVWYCGAVACCALGMGCKAVILTAPLVVLAYDRSFLSPSWAGTIRSRWGLYVGLCASWFVLLPTRIAQHVLAPPTGAKVAVGFGFKDISPLEYAATQFGVIVQYLKLSIWPRSLCLDYNWPVARELGTIAPAAAIVVTLLIATGWALWRRHALGFVGAWFFLILAPTSTIVPIRDPLFEHRMYLPLAAVVTIVVFAAYALLRSYITPRRESDGTARLSLTALMALVALPLMLGTISRNRDYVDELTILRDVVAKRGAHARAEYNIGTALIDQGKNDEAIPWLLAATKSDSRLVYAYYNLGKAYARLNRNNDAYTWYAKAIEVDPSMAKALSDLGNLLTRDGRAEEAIGLYRRAIAAKPRYAPPYFNLSQVLFARGDHEPALDVLRAATVANPAEARLHVALAQTLQALGRHAEAIAEYREALRRDSDNAAALQALRTP